MTNHSLSQLELLATKISGLFFAFDQVGLAKGSSWRFTRPIIATPTAIPADPSIESAPGGGRVGARPIDACFVGRVAQNKGIIDLLTAWKVVVTNRPGASLVVAGGFNSEALKVKVVRLIAELSLAENVRLTGFLSEPEKHKLLSNARLFVFPSYEEGWSISVMEGAISGALPITYDLPAYDYLGESAQKVPVGRPDELARRIVRFLADEPARLRATAEVGTAVRKLTIEQIATDELRCFEELLTMRNPSTLSA
ncbi:MAG: glycosyltransferase [Thermoplasmata archaeon]